jgi:RNA polymerase sigma factor (sigma-70 family)
MKGMHDIGSPAKDDSALLARWVRDGSEDAFAELVRCYQRLVLGAAFRRTGDEELARDIAQQVFATLAAKANLLLDRKNLAGWLYYATSHISARAAQAEARRRRNHDALGDSSASEPTRPPQWALIEEALAKLGGKERESLTLHYFQDLSYPEIAAVLGIEETAARKRVSRALRRLEIQMRRRGVRGPIPALVAAAAAQQSSITPPSCLAAAAIAASGASGTTSLAVTITTLMSYTPLKIAACASILVLAPLVLQNHANARMRAELAELRRTQSVAPATSPASTASLHEQRAALQMALAAKRRARMEAENRVASLTTFERKLADEVVISFGTLDTMARKLARVLSAMEQLDPTNHSEADADARSPEERERLARELSQAIPEMMGIIREIPRLEREPEKAARFYATMFSEVMQCDDGVRAAIEPDLKQWVEALQQDGLALVQRPRGKAPDWDARRSSSTARMFATISPKIPPDKRSAQRLDQILRGAVEGEVYEFLTNGTVR